MTGEIELLEKIDEEQEIQYMESTVSEEVEEPIVIQDAKTKEQERYFICHECGELTTWTEQLEDCSSGGTGMCTCKFMLFEWSEKYDTLEPWYPREYIEWTEISKRWYEHLASEKNTVIRLRTFHEIPIVKRMST